ncbi:hypothetical protein E8K88_16705 [Lampropedia aestuarii]|uniref:Uncharacterized protein n=1 Tax=Lampropedia aestuarii TaxID=2562762 RepID=A0A4S5BJT6_9BURK|nr:hypothetical protein [Lampropedia aestuarii]THJ30911.1 hypothetical protein E8K88_16705 [Lampropedia aestuarii]
MNKNFSGSLFAFGPLSVQRLKKASWRDNWFWYEALLRLSLTPSVLPPKCNEPLKAIKDRIKIYFSVIGCYSEEQLKTDAEWTPAEMSLLIKDAEKMYSLMCEKKLPGKAELPPIIWMRLLNEAGINIAPDAWSGYLGWKYANERKGVLLYTFDKKHPGSKARLRRGMFGFGNLTGFSADELLAAPNTTFGACPTKFKWTVKLHKTDPETRLLLGKEVDALKISKPLLDDHAYASEPRSADESYGAGLTDALTKALTQYALPKQLIRKKRADEKGRKFASDNQTAKLLDTFLTGKTRTLTRYEESTRLAAIRGLVALPRGRPRK